MRGLPFFNGRNFLCVRGNVRYHLLSCCQISYSYWGKKSDMHYIAVLFYKGCSEI